MHTHTHKLLPPYLCPSQTQAVAGLSAPHMAWIFPTDGAASLSVSSAPLSELYPTATWDKTAKLT